MTRIGKNSHIYLDFNDYTQGFKPLDTQHRDIVLMINEISDVIFSESIDCNLLLEKMNVFEKLVIYHFGFEHEMMEEMGYDQEKKQLHSEHHHVAVIIVANIKALCNDHSKNRNLAFKLGSELMGWFKSHEILHDHPMVNTFKKYLDDHIDVLKEQNH